MRAVVAGSLLLAHDSFGVSTLWPGIAATPAEEPLSKLATPHANVPAFGYVALTSTKSSSWSAATVSLKQRRIRSPQYLVALSRRWHRLVDAHSGVAKVDLGVQPSTCKCWSRPVHSNPLLNISLLMEMIRSCCGARANVPFSPSLPPACEARTPQSP